MNEQVHQNLSQNFPHSDILFRFQKLLSMQTEAYQLVAHSILTHSIYQHNAKLNQHLLIWKIRCDTLHNNILTINKKHFIIISESQRNRHST